MKKTIIAISILILFSSAAPAFAQVAKQKGIVPLVNPIGGTVENPEGQTNMAAIIGGIVKAGLALIGSLTLVVFVYGGFLWMTSGGNADRVAKGKTIMMWAVLGLFIIFGSYAILSTVISGLGLQAGA